MLPGEKTKTFLHTGSTVIYSTMSDQMDLKVPGIISTAQFIEEKMHSNP